jgi:hypothetical protein
VEVDLIDRLAVQAPLGLGERPEHGMGAVAHTVGKPGLVEHGGDVAGGADDVGGLGDDVRLGPGDAVAQHRLGVEAPPTDRQAFADPPHLAEVGAGVEQRTECHVAGDATEAVEPGDPASGVAGGAVGAHRSVPTGSMRDTAIAAPNPLSIPTTVTPAAQVAIIPNNAVTPSSPAP